MRFNSIIFASVLIGALPLSSAAAQDFDGAYGGAQAGWQSTEVAKPETGLGELVLDGNRQSFAGGVFAGFDRQITDRVVVGAEAGIDLGVDDAAETRSGPDRLVVDPKWSLDVTARAGYLVAPDTLAYVRGGYARSRVETSASLALVDVADSANRDGWLMGAGIERQLLHKISGRLEYRYSDLGEGAGAFDRHRLLAGIAYRF